MPIADLDVYIRVGSTEPHTMVISKKLFGIAILVQSTLAHDTDIFLANVAIMAPAASDQVMSAIQVYTK